MLGGKAESVHYFLGFLLRPAARFLGGAMAGWLNMIEAYKLHPDKMYMERKKRAGS